MLDICASVEVTIFLTNLSKKPKIFQVKQHIFCTLLLKHQNGLILLIVCTSCADDNEAIKPKQIIRQEDKTMKNTNITEINMDLLEMVTGGTLGSCDPALGETGPLNKVESCDPPLKETGPLEWYDSTKDETGPLNYPYLTALIDWRADYPYKEHRFGIRV